MAVSVDKVYASPDGYSASQCSQRIQQLIKSQVNGQLQIATAQDQTWVLEFRVGRLVWAMGGEHRFRRWQRLLQQLCSGVNPQSLQLREKGIGPEWEYLALMVLIQRQQINRETAIALVTENLKEITFDLLHNAAQVRQMSVLDERSAYLEKPLAILSPQEMTEVGLKQLQTWHQMGLGAFSPNLAPVIRDPELLSQATSAKTYQMLNGFLKGHLSLRDLAVLMRHDWLSVAQGLSTYIRRDLITFQALPDLDSPCSASHSRVPTVSVANLPLVMCIDDSPQACYLLEETLRGGGYRCLSIQDSIQALPALIKQKPDLIFLDLVMPVANGYEICGQIRRLPRFREVPIIILSGNDGFVDRVRAKSVGATDFLNKPVEPEKILRIVRKYLAVQKT